MHRIWRFQACWTAHSSSPETRPTPVRVGLPPPAPEAPGGVSDRNSDSDDRPHQPPTEIPASRRQAPSSTAKSASTLFGRSWLRRRIRCREVYFRHFTRSFGGGEVRVVWLESSPLGKDVIRKLLNVSVVILQSVVIALAFHGDAVFRAGQLILQAQEILVRL